MSIGAHHGAVARWNHDFIGSIFTDLQFVCIWGADPFRLPRLHVSLDDIVLNLRLPLRGDRDDAR
jgi:hypothetical protein